ncbi:microfibril-associated glycoprotein 4-like [Anneissia japonica]|uniref:microfibril-associated glycoprotein 4-like n=1 Tax=Anneissia japonica TaxID=1529436 RepID=UPI0014258C27|nr:microfibril-associated glycoprotein 4-like [Anneissia japonica]
MEHKDLGLFVILAVIVQVMTIPVGQGASTSSGCPPVNQTCNTMLKELESVRILLDTKEKACDCGVLSDAQKAIAANNQLLRNSGTECPEFPAPVDCAEVKQRNPKANSGPYYIKPRGYHSRFRVYCDMFTDGGGWTVFQRRVDGSVVFNRTWQNYKEGFGTSLGEHWLGNDYLHYLTRQGLYTLRIDMEDWHDSKTYAKYSNFNIEEEGDNYRLDFGTYLSGTALDRLTYHKKQRFSTFDRDNDYSSSANCAALHSGGWWFKSCDECNLNGKYYHSDRYTASRDNGIEWKGGSSASSTGRNFYSLKVTEMKVRPIAY